MEKLRKILRILITLRINLKLSQILKKSCISFQIFIFETSFKKKLKYMKALKILKIILYLLFALLFINAGLDKFFHYMPMPEMTTEMQKVMDAFTTLKWVMLLTGMVELVAGILILFPKTRVLGAVMIFPVMIGIICHNATFMPQGLVIAGVLFVINISMIADNWSKIKPLFS